MFVWKKKGLETDGNKQAHGTGGSEYTSEQCHREASCGFQNLNQYLYQQMCVRPHGNKPGLGACLMSICYCKVTSTLENADNTVPE